MITPSLVVEPTSGLRGQWFFWYLSPVAFDEQGTQAEAPRFDSIYRDTEMVSKPQILIHTLG